MRKKILYLVCFTFSAHIYACPMYHFSKTSAAFFEEEQTPNLDALFAHILQTLAKQQPKK